MQAVSQYVCEVEGGGDGPSRTSRCASLIFLPCPPVESVTDRRWGMTSLPRALPAGRVRVVAAPGTVDTSLASAEKRITCEFSSKPVSYGFTFTIITYPHTSA